MVKAPLDQAKRVPRARPIPLQEVAIPFSGIGPPWTGVEKAQEKLAEESDHERPSFGRRFAFFI